MSVTVEYLSNRASPEEIAEHLSRCDADFVPPLSTRVRIPEYAEKIACNAARFEAWAGDTLVGLLAAYCDGHGKRIAYVTSVSVLRKWMGQGIAASLMGQCIAHAQALHMQEISLEVACDNVAAIKLYEKCGFVAGNAKAPFVGMSLNLKIGEEHGRQT